MKKVPEPLGFNSYVILTSLDIHSLFRGKPGVETVNYNVIENLSNLTMQFCNSTRYAPINNINVQALSGMLNFEISRYLYFMQQNDLLTSDNPIVEIMNSITIMFYYAASKQEIRILIDKLPSTIDRSKATIAFSNSILHTIH
jgi:hypothetical protein